MPVLAEQHQPLDDMLFIADERRLDLQAPNSWVMDAMRRHGTSVM